MEFTLIRTLGVAPGRMLISLALLVAATAVTCGEDASKPATNAIPGVARTEEFGLTEHEMAMKIDQVEAAVATCMKDAGFEYVPADVVTVRKAMGAIGKAPGVSDEAYIARYGYGITTHAESPGRQLVVGERNVSIYERLAPANRVAYARTLLGDDTTATFVVSLDVENFSTTGGCTRKAIEKAFATEQLSPSYLNPTTVLVEQHPRMVAAIREWRACMRAAGFDYNRQEEAESRLAQRLNAITRGSEVSSLQGADREALVVLQAEEKAIAAADLKCAVLHLDKVEEQVEFEVTGRRPN